MTPKATKPFLFDFNRRSDLMRKISNCWRNARNERGIYRMLSHTPYPPTTGNRYEILYGLFHIRSPMRDILYWISPIEDIPASKEPGIHTSKNPRMQASKHPIIWASKHPSIQEFKHPIMQAWKIRRTQASKLHPW